MTRLRAMFDRRPFNSPWIIAMVSRYGLPWWFAIESVLGIAVAMQDRRYLFFDARLYLEATRVWLAGGDPWNVQIAGNYFAAPPPALIAAVVIVGGIATIRLRRLPWWWLLFPPLVQCVLSGNVQSLIVPLILLPAGGLAVILKVYAGLPLAILGRWRSLVAAAVIMLATVPFLPWATYVNEFALIS